MDTNFRFHQWFQFFQHLGHYHTESEMEDPSEEGMCSDFPMHVDQGCQTCGVRAKFGPPESPLDEMVRRLNGRHYLQCFNQIGTYA